MNKQIMKKVGFEKELEYINQLKCPFCKQAIDVDKFRDNLSVKEFSISGLCQECQDKMFG